MFPRIADPQKRAYLTALSRKWHFGEAAAAAGIIPRTGWDWRHDDTDEAFQAGMVEAGRMFVQYAEAVMWGRGIEGVQKAVYYGGRRVGYETVYDTTAAIFMLKGASPEKYRERFEHSGPDGTPLFVEAFPTPDTGNPLKAVLALTAAVVPSEPAAETDPTHAED